MMRDKPTHQAARMEASFPLNQDNCVADATNSVLYVAQSQIHFCNPLKAKNRYGHLDQGYSNFWCYGAHEEIDHNLWSPTINFF